MTTQTRPDVAEMTKLVSALQTDTVALAERTQKHDSEAAEIARVRADLSKRADTFAKLAADTRAHLAKVMGQAQPKAAPVGNGQPKPMATKAAKAVKAKRRNRKPKGQAKYRNPDNPKQTWTGIGTVPGFIRESGKPKEAFLIAQSA